MQCNDSYSQDHQTDITNTTEEFSSCQIIEIFDIPTTPYINIITSYNNQRLSSTTDMKIDPKLLPQISNLSGLICRHTHIHITYASLDDTRDDDIRSIIYICINVKEYLIMTSRPLLIDDLYRMRCPALWLEIKFHLSYMKSSVHDIL